MRAQLIPTDGGEPIVLTQDMSLFGRKDNCDQRLLHKSVSKHHCVIVKTDGLLLLRDLGSTNGTRVNGQRVRRAALLPNDVLSIASLKFRVHFGPDAPNVTPDGRTQQISADELEEMMKNKPGGEKPAVKTNSLPDIYPDDSSVL